MNVRINWLPTLSNRTGKSSLSKSLWPDLGVGRDYQHEVKLPRYPRNTDKYSSGLIFAAALTLNQNLLLSELLFQPIKLQPSTLYPIPATKPLQPSVFSLHP